MEKHYLETGKGRLFYLHQGSGEPLLFLHGNNEDSSIFQNQYNFFTQKYSVYALDTRGHGQSDFSVQSLTFKRMAEDILLLMDQNGLDSVHIIGYSDGGNIGLYFSSHFPERVKSLITMGANYEADALVEPLYQDLLDEKEKLQMITDEKDRRRKESVLQLMLDNLDLTEQDLQSISIPVFVMAGEKDVIKRSHTEKIAEIIPKAELFLVPEGGHDFFIDNPDSLKEAATLFYKKISN